MLSKSSLWVDSITRVTAIIVERWRCKRLKRFSELRAWHNALLLFAALALWLDPGTPQFRRGFTLRTVTIRRRLSLL